MVDNYDALWELFKNEQKLNKELVVHIKGLNKRLEKIGQLEKSSRDLALENDRLRAEVKRLRASQSSMGRKE